MLIKPEAAKKRIQRAKSQLHEADIAVELPDAEQLSARLHVVHDVLYLMFNEGYSTTHGWSRSGMTSVKRPLGSAICCANTRS